MQIEREHGAEGQLAGRGELPRRRPRSVLPRAWCEHPRGQGSVPRLRGAHRLPRVRPGRTARSSASGAACPSASVVACAVSVPRPPVAPAPEPFGPYFQFPAGPRIGERGLVCRHARRFLRSPAEIGIILLVVLLLFGGSQLPKLAKNIGKAQKEFKDGLAEGQKDAAEDTADRPRRPRPTTRPELAVTTESRNDAGCLAAPASFRVLVGSRLRVRRCDRRSP